MYSCISAALSLILCLLILLFLVRAAADTVIAGTGSPVVGHIAIRTAITIDIYCYYYCSAATCIEEAASIASSDAARRQELIQDRS